MNTSVYCPPSRASQLRNHYQSFAIQVCSVCYDIYYSLATRKIATQAANRILTMIHYYFILFFSFFLFSLTTITVFTELSFSSSLARIRLFPHSNPRGNKKEWSRLGYVYCTSRYVFDSLLRQAWKSTVS